MFALKIILEVAAVILLIIGYLNEEKVVAFERNLIRAIRGNRRPVRRVEPARKQTVRRVQAAEEPRRVA